MAKNILTDKQEMFCQEYLKDLNATQAAIRAGYSEKVAQQQGSRLLLNVVIQKKISELMQKRIKRLEIKQDDVVKELIKLGFTDMKSYAKWDSKGVELKSSDELTEEESVAVAEIMQTKHGIRFKLHDKVRTLELLGKHFGIFHENFNINLDNCGAIRDIEIVEEDNLVHLPNKVPIGSPVNGIDNKEEAVGK